MNSPIAAMANTKTNLWGCKQRQQMFLLIACSHGNQGHFLPWIVNTNVSTRITVQNLACLDCLHLFVVVVAIVFPLTTPSDCNKCAEWFTDSATDDATNPTRKISESFWNRFFRWHESSKQQVNQRTVDSASEATWKIGPSLWGDSQTCKELWATSLPKNGWRLPLCSCSCSVVMLAIDLKNHAPCIVNIRFAPKQLKKTKASLIFGGIHHALFHMFVLSLSNFCLTKMSDRALFWVWTRFLMKCSVPRLWFRFVSKTRLFQIPEILIVHICGTRFPKITNSLFMMKLNDRHGTNNLIVSDKAQSAVLVCKCWLGHCYDYFCLARIALKWGLRVWCLSSTKLSSRMPHWFSYGDVSFSRLFTVRVFS